MVAEGDGWESADSGRVGLGGVKDEGGTIEVRWWS